MQNTLAEAPDEIRRIEKTIEDFQKLREDTGSRSRDFTKDQELTNDENQTKEKEDQELADYLFARSLKEGYDAHQVLSA